MVSAPTTLRPPQIPIDRDLRWVLLAAFASGTSDPGTPASAERAARLVRELGLVGQVTSRLSRQRLLGVLTAVEVDALTRFAARWTMRGLAAAQVTTSVCEIATREQIELALLKQAALRALGLVTPSKRYASDVDLLVRPGDVTRLTDALLRQGFTRERDKEHAHGVVVVRSTENVGIELHTSIIGVALEPNERDVDLEALLERQLLTPNSPTSNYVWLPRLPILGVHLIWQGWGIFRYAPHAPEHKTPFRLLADLQHLGVHADPDLAAQIRQLLPTKVPTTEYDALVELAATLTSGSCEPRSDSSRLVLNHLLATKLDPRYRDSLYLERQREALHSEGLSAWLQRQCQRALFPSEAQLQSLVRSGLARSTTWARFQIPMQLATRSWRGVVASLRRSRS